jgi:hypothetical protein
MGRPLKVAKAEGKSSALNNPPGITNTYGVVGGNVLIPGTQLVCRVKIGDNAEATGSIIRQKGRAKYLVEDAAGNRGICVLADLANGSLTAGTMTVTTSAGRLARLTNRWGHGFDGEKYLLSFNAIDSGATAFLTAVAPYDIPPGTVDDGSTLP